MKEISLNILDIAENSVKAGATLTEITVNETDDTLTLKISDNGCGMTAETLKAVTDPFYTTRTTRKVGMGLPLLKMEAEQTGGTFDISSRAESEYPEDHGTEVTAVFNKKHIDYTPLGDVVSSIVTLIQGHPDTDFLFTHTYGSKSVALDTRELRAVLEEVPLNSYEVLKFIEETLEKGRKHMKSLAELQAIKEKMRDKVILREGVNSVRVVVGMATCGIAAGARPVLNALVEGVNKEGLTEKVTVSQTGCIGICQLEPIVEVFEPGKEKITYVKMTPEKAARVIEEHLKNGNVVNEYTIAAHK